MAFFLQMGNALGVCETIYKVEYKGKVLLGEIWLASQNVTTRVSLLYLEPAQTTTEVSCKSLQWDRQQAQPN